ncbi:hypothetical protein ACSQ67_005435 [Phaseolus vulgaris]
MTSSEKPYTKYETRRRNPNPKSCVLLVIDVQNHFSSIATPIISNLNTTISLCRRASIPVIFTRHCHKPGEHRNMLEEWWPGDLIMDGAWESHLMEGLEREEGDVVVEKNTYRKTRLEERLVEMGVEEVIVAGVMTNLCCETTAREAFVRGFRVFFSADATATSSVDLHDATLNNLAYGFAYLLDCDRLKQALSVN